MFYDEVQLKEACIKILESKGIRLKYLPLLLELSKEGVEYNDGKTVYENFKKWTDLAIENNLI